MTVAVILLFITIDELPLKCETSEKVIDDKKILSRLIIPNFLVCVFYFLWTVDCRLYV